MRIRLTTDDKGNACAKFPKGAPNAWNVPKRWIAKYGDRFIVDEEKGLLTVRAPEGQFDVIYRINPPPQGKPGTNFYLTLED